jgi:folate-binding protein YgfZ
MNSHFGNPLLEQRKLLEHKAYIHRDNQAVVEIIGEGVLGWLHSISSQNIANLKPGESAESLILDPQGRIEHQLKVIATDQGALIICNRDRRSALIDWLEKMKFRTRVEIKPVELLVVGAFAELELQAPCWVDPWAKTPVGSVSYSKQKPEWTYREYLVGNLSEISLEEAGEMAFQALRIAAHRPEITDCDERSLPHELDWLSSAVHLSKGCYRGQETVAKVHNLGHPPRRLAQLSMEVGDLLPEPGEKVFYSDKEVGKVLASGLHYEQGSICLALLNRITPYTDLMVAGMAAAQEVIVPADAGKAANLPRPSAFKLSGKK